MTHFWSIILLLALMGVTIYVIFFWVGKKWASWQA
jgi:NitT/TauT family transport system permease protein